METFLADLKAQGHAPDYVKKHYVSVNAMYTWAVKHGKVSATKPFAAVEKASGCRTRSSQSTTCPPAAEVEKLFEFADADLDPVLIRFKQFTPPPA